MLVYAVMSYDRGPDSDWVTEGIYDSKEKAEMQIKKLKEINEFLFEEDFKLGYPVFRIKEWVVM